MLAVFAGLATIAAATALNAGKEAHLALELLELGRGVIATLLLEMRTDISDLHNKHPELAKILKSLRDELDSPADGVSLVSPGYDASFRDKQARQHEANQQFEDIKLKISA